MLWLGLCEREVSVKSDKNHGHLSLTRGCMFNPSINDQKRASENPINNDDELRGNNVCLEDYQWQKQLKSKSGEITSKG